MRLRMYDQQGQGHALLVLREVLPSGLVLRTNIDATRLGNVARFFNHSCDGGSLELVVVRRRGSLLPAVALFAAHDISPAEELTFAYGPPTSGRAAAASGRPGEERQQQQQQLERPQQRCLCGSSACLGLMPNEA
ncbi:Histone-lysine N-methyltransferase SUVR3 [Tetrabaena socialis]|uniref:Histone-lysine N-methyltransferase SUVR3 n=1 Tax=Tetrabaena socialis TaxID=47790 RepID=A0A2J7ZRQ6_9CHLO|nr:Histone-lysine N-methyltransferase SUVR3 [Tetrabaena socialis]|eukprot:PNH02938.1 Histone-lysine N-methyltransferase SUVR3 [Tetrabaena socialis]